MTEIRLEAELDYTMAALDWCSENVRADEYEVRTAWPAKAIYLRFADSRAAVLFKLRWSR